MITPNDLIKKFQQAYNEKWGYIINTAGETWTQSKQKSIEQNYQNAVAKGDKKAMDKWEMGAEYGSKWIGKTVADCSGLFYWAFKQLGGYMYHGSNTMWSKYTTSKGTLSGGKRSDGKTLKPGTAVFKLRDGNDYHHVGLYIGDGKVIEAQGTKTGVIQSKISNWHSWGELKGVSYNNTNDGGVSPMNYQDAVVTAKGGVNMRSTAQTSQVRITTIPQGAAIKAAKYDNDWSAVEYNGKSGYVMNEFISYGTLDDDGKVIDDALAIIVNMEKELSKLKALIQA